MLVKCLITGPEERKYTNIKKISLELVRNYPNECLTWFDNCLSEVPTDCLISTEKENLLSSIKTGNEEIFESIFKKIYKRSMARQQRSKRIM